ncbi:MAG TPA: Gfo/Idh/MocA family oxidoreductase [Dehalococcoidia bacterium]
MSRVRVAFIGAGRIADLHAAGYQATPDSQLYAVCDTDADLAERRARAWGAERHLSDYRELLSDPAVDAVEVLTPHHLHRDMAVAALDAGKHVSLQKPMARTLAEADEIVAAAGRSGTVFRVFENFRYYPPYVRAKELIDEGAIGNPLSMRMKVIDGNPQEGWDVGASSWAWRLDEELSGGGPVVFDHGYHIFSIAMFFLGAVSEVFAWINRTELGSGLALDAPAVIMWRCLQRPRFGTWESIVSPDLVVPSKYYATDEWLEITGSHGVLWVNRCSGEMLSGPPLVLYRDGESRAIDDVDSDWASSFVEGVRHFVQAIREGGAPELSAVDAREVLRFSVAAHRSAREGRPVALSEVTS